MSSSSTGSVVSVSSTATLSIWEPGVASSSMRAITVPCTMSPPPQVAMWKVTVLPLICAVAFAEFADTSVRPAGSGSLTVALVRSPRHEFDHCSVYSTSPPGVVSPACVLRIEVVQASQISFVMQTPARQLSGSLQEPDTCEPHGVPSGCSESAGQEAAAPLQVSCASHSPA